MSWLASLLLIFVTLLPSSLALGADAIDDSLDCLQRTNDFSKMTDKELLRALRGVRGFTTEAEFVELEALRKTFIELNQKIRDGGRPFSPSEMKEYGETLLGILKLTRVSYRLNDQDPDHVVIEIIPVEASKDGEKNYVHPLNHFAWGLSKSQKTTLALDLDPNRKLIKGYAAQFQPIEKRIIASNEIITDLLPTLHEGHEVIHSFGTSSEKDLLEIGQVPSTPRMLIKTLNAGDDGYDYLHAIWNDEAAAHAYSLSALSAPFSRWLKKVGPNDPVLQRAIEERISTGLLLTGRIKTRLARSEDQLQEALTQLPQLSARELLGQRLRADPSGAYTYIIQPGKHSERSILFFPSKSLEKALDRIEMLPDADLTSKNPFHRPSADAESVRQAVVQALRDELNTELAAVQKAKAAHQAAFTFFQRRRIEDNYVLDQPLIDAFRKPYQEYNEQRQKDRERVKVGK